MESEKTQKLMCCCGVVGFRVWSVRYNHSHDQLVLTGSSDSRLILSNMVSISSEPFGHLVDDDDLSDTEETQQDDKYASLSEIFWSVQISNIWFKNSTYSSMV